MTAAFMSMGTAHAIVGETPDPFADLGVLDGAALDSFLNTVDPTLATQLDNAIDVFGVNLTDADGFADLGLPNGATLDTAQPILSAFVDPYADLVNPNDSDAFADLFGATNGSVLDTAFPVLSADLDPWADAVLNTDADPFVDLFGAANGTALDTLVDTIPVGTTNLGALLDPVADLFANAGMVF